MAIVAKVQNLEDVKSELQKLPDRLRRKSVSSSLRKGAALIRSLAKQNVPMLSADAPAIRLGYRSRGLLKKRISVRSSKVERRKRNVGVFINVRPAKASEAGAKSPRDPFYWRWVEFGWTQRDGRQHAGYRFLQRAASNLPDVVPIFTEEMRRAIARINSGDKTA